MKKFLSKLLSVFVAISLLAGSAPIAALADTQIVSDPTGGNYDIQESQDAGTGTGSVTVRFLDFDGTELKSASVTVGDAYPNSEWPTPSRDGYDFVGWNDGSGTVTELPNVQADTTLTAQYIQLFTLTYENWDGTLIKTVSGIRAGTDVVATNYNSDVPQREDFSFQGWEPAEIPSLSADATITAVFEPLVQHSITINYIFHNQKQAAEPYVAQVSDGYLFTETITSPVILGYTADQLTVSITEPITQDYNIDVIFNPNSDTAYQLVHKQQDLTGGGYTAVETETRSGETGSMTTIGAADVKTYDGFNLLTNLYTVNQEIAADGTTVVELLYDRQIHYVLYETANGTYIEPQVGVYGTPVVVPPNPTRVGYTFAGWDVPIPATIGSSDVTVTALWTPLTVGYTIVVWRENANNTSYSYALTITGQTALAGSTVSTFNSALITDSLAQYFTYHHLDPVTINGDGSTILNVYCSRNTYTASFALVSGTGTNYLTANGGTYYHSGDSGHIDYSFTAKYDSDITNLWPSYVGPDSVKFYGWSSAGAAFLYTSKRLTFMPELLSRTFTANYTGTCKDTLVYMLETPDGTGTVYNYNGTNRYYKAAANLAQVVYSVGGGWGLKEISGFSGQNVVTVITGGNQYSPTARTITLYYTRNKNTITFHNGSDVSTTASIFLEASIASYNYTPTRPAGVPLDFVFTGWYTDQNLYDNSLFVWAGATMPVNGLIVYAGWKKPTYPVVFELNYESGGVYTSQVVIKDETASQVTNPVRAGYHFDYWYYVDGGVQKLFTFSMPITRAYDLYAHWTASVVGFTVRYVAAGGGPVYDENGNVLANKTGADDVSTLVTEAALAGYTSTGLAMYPDRLSSSITLVADAANNVITFTYTADPQAFYIVRYVDTNGTELAPQTGPLSTSASLITVRYRTIPGYSPTVYQKTVVLADETSAGAVSQNIITFVYRPNSTGTYIVHYYLQNVNDNLYTLDAAATVTNSELTLGTTANATIKSYPGFTYVSGISVVSGVITSDTTNPLTLSVYYNRNMVDYSASYLDADTSPIQRLTADTTGAARYGRTLTLIAKDISGYRLDTAMSPSPASLTIGLDSAANHVDFYYHLRTDIVVTVRFLDESGNNIAPSKEFTGATDRNVKLGSPYSYTLLSGEQVIEFNGETYRHLTTEADTASLTVAEFGNTLDFHYRPDTYTVTYNANGGSGAPTDPNAHRANSSVAIIPSSPAYGENHFEGWTTDLSAIGQVYTTPAALSAVTLMGDPFTMPKHDVTLYAVWSHLTSVLSYASETPYTGTLPGSVTVPINTPTNVAGGSGISRPGYVFAGWQLKDGTGQLSGPLYGPGTDNPTISIVQNTTLYATWTPQAYTVSYMNNLPAAAQARFVNPNTLTGYTIESPDFTLQAASAAGYTFTGWYTDSGYTTLASAPALPTGSTGNRVFYAGFVTAPVDGFTVTGFTGPYDGAPHGVTFNDPEGQLLPTDVVTYSTPNSYTDVTGGPVPVTVTVTRDGTVIWTGTANVNITPKTITLTADNIDVLYDGVARSLDVTVPTGATGAVTAADAEAIRQSLVYSVGGVQVPNTFVNAMPTTTVTVSATHPNYVIVPATPTVTIGKRPVTITADSLTGVVYDGMPHTVSTFTVTPATDTTGLITGDSVASVTLIDNTRTEVGINQPTPSQAVMGVGNAANYTFTYEKGTLEIVKSDQLTVNLSAGAGTYVYDGQTHGYTVDTAGVPVTLEYRIGTGDWVTVTPTSPLPSYTEVGGYPLTVRASNPNYSNQPTDTETLTITKRDVTVRAGSGSFTYTGETFTVTDWSVDAPTATTGLIGTDTITDVSLTGNSRKDLGANDILIGVTDWSEGADPNNYNVITVDGSIEVTQNPGALSVSVDDLSVTYDGVGHRLSYTVDVPAGTPYTVSYKLGDGEWVALPAGGLLPLMEDAGVYPIALKIESPNYAGVGEDAATLTIGRRAVTFTAGTSTGNVYTGSPVSVTYTVSPETEFAGLLAGQTASATLVGTPQTNAGTYVVSFDEPLTKIKRGSKDVTANYDITYENGLIGIAQAQSQAQATDAVFVYNAAARTYEAPVLRDTDGRALTGVTTAWSITPLAADASGWNTTAFPSETDVKAILAGGAADTYRIYVRLTQPNYETKIVAADLTITPLPVTLTADTNDNFPYTLLSDGTAKVWSIDTAHWQAAGLAADTLYAGDTVGYTLANNTESQVGDGHAVTFADYGIVNDAHAKNYQITTVDGHIRVVRGTVAATLTGEGLTFPYDATAHTLPQPTVTVPTEDGDPIDRTSDFTFTYIVTKDGHSTTYDTLPTFTDAGEYTVKIKANSDVYADPAPVTVTVTVQKRPLTLTSETLSVPYDATEHSVAILADATGYAVPGHAVDAASLALLAGQVSAATLAGTYPVQIALPSVTVLDGTTDVTDNYEIAIVPGGLTITPITVTAAQLGLTDVTTVYDGQPHAIDMPESIVIGGQTIDLTDTSRFVFTYTARDLNTPGAPVTNEPGNPDYTDASRHQVGLAITDLTGSIVFEPASAVVTVNRRDVTVTPDDGTFLYDGNEHAVLTYDVPRATVGSDTGLVGSDQLAVTLVDNRRTDAGENEITWVDPVMTVGDIDNYNLIHATGTIKVNAIDALTLDVTAWSSVYDAKPHGYTFVTNEPDPSALTLSYSVDGTTFIPFTSASELPTYVDAGSYPLTIRASSPNFATPAEDSATLVISKRPVAVTPTDATFLYDGTPKTLSDYTVERADIDGTGQPVGTRGLLGTDAATATLTNNVQTDAGAYTVGSENAQPIGGANLANYAFEYKTGTLTIQKRSGLEITLTPDSSPYDGQEHGFTVTTNAVGDTTLEYSTDGGNTWTPFTTEGDMPTRVNAGDTPLIVRATNDNYDVPTATASDTLTITPVALTLAVVSQSFVFDALPHSLTMTATGLVGDDSLGSYTLNPASRTDAGIYDVQAVQGDTQIVSATRLGNQIGNYTITYVPGVLTIVDFKLTGYEGVYDGGPHTVTVDVPTEINDLYTTTYTYNGVTTTEPPVFTDVGEYPVTVTLTPKDPDSGLPTFSKDTTVIITAREITLNVDSINKTYDGAYASLHVTLPEGAAANETDAATILANVTFTVGGAPVANAFVNAAQLAVTVGSTCPNYVITPVDTSVQITKRALTLTAGSATKVYDEQPVTVTYTFDSATYSGDVVTNASGLLRQHSLSATLVDATQTEVVSEAPVTFNTALTAITEGGASVLGNYDVRYVDGKITITQAEGLRLNLNDYVGVYDAQAHSIGIGSVMDGTRSVDPANFTWTYGTSAATANNPSLTRTDVTDMLVYVRGVSVDGNYPDVTGVARLAITARPVLVTPGSGTYVYDGQAHSVTTYTTEKAPVIGGSLVGTRGLIGTDDVTVTLTNNVQTAPGEYLIGWVSPTMTAGQAANYDFQHADGWLTINKATSGLTIDVVDDTVTYDAQEHRLTYTVTAPEGTPYTVEYSTDNGATWTPVGPDGLLPANTDAGVYPVKARVTSPYYEDGYVSTDEGTLTLNQRDLNIRSETNTFVYDQTAHTVAGLWQVTATTANAGLVGGSANHAIDSFGYAAGKDNAQTPVGGHDVLVNAASVVIKDADGQDVTHNYNITADPGHISVTAQPTTMEATDRTVTYNGQPQPFELPTLLDAAGEPVTEPLTYSYSTDGITWSTTPITYENVTPGGYDIQIRVESPNYQPAVTTAHLTIVPAPITVKADTNDGFIFTLDKNGDPVVWSIDTVTLTEGTLFKGETLDFVLSNNTQAEVGNHDVNLDSAAVLLGDADVSTNYAITLEDGHIAVSQGQADAYMTAQPVTGVYKSADYTLEKPVISVQSNTGEYVDMTSRYSIRYDVTNPLTGETWTFNNTLPHFTNAGTYNVAITATSGTATSPVTGETTITISPLPIVFTSGDNHTTPYTYNGAEQSVQPWIIGMGALAGTDQVDGFTFAAGQENVATNVTDRPVLLDSVTIVKGAKDVTANYTIIYAPGRIVIMPLVVSGGLTLTGVSHVYDAGTHSIGLSDQLVTAIGTFSLSGTTTPEGAARFQVTYATTPQGGSMGPAQSTNPGFVNVSNQGVTVLVTDVTGNMLIVPQSEAVEITKRDVTITPDSLTVAYNGLGHTITTYSHPKATMVDGVAVGTTGLVGSDDVTVTLVNNGPHIVPGVYTVSWSDPAVMTTGDANNYNFLHDTGTLTITKATGIDLYLSAEDVTYDGLPHGYTAVPAVPDGTPYTLEVLRPDGSWVPVTPFAPLPVEVNAGDYPLTVRITSPYYDDTVTKTAVLHIARRNVTIASGDNSASPYTYNGLEQSVTGAIVSSTTPLAIGDNLDPAGNVFMPGLSNVNTDVVDRPVTLSAVTLVNGSGASVNDNYAITFQNGRIVINQAGSTATAATRTEPYTGTPYSFPVPTLSAPDGTPLTGVSYAYSTTPLGAGDSGWIDITDFPTREDVLRGAGGTVVGDMIYVRISHPNYGTQVTTSTLTITPAPITVTADTDDTFVYTLDADGNPVTWAVNTATLTAGTLYKGASIDYTLANNTQAAIGAHDVFVNTCSVVFGGTDYTGNYSIQKLPGHITVSKGTAESQIIASGDYVTYDGETHGIPEPIVTVLGQGGVSFDRTGEFDVSYDVTVAGSTQTWHFDDLADFNLTDAGVYTITVSAVSDLHATPAPAVATLTIAKRPLSVQSQDNSATPYTYNGHAQSVRGDYIVTGLLPSDHLTDLAYVEGQGNTGTDVTNHAVLLNNLAVLEGTRDVTANYTVGYLPGWLTINALVIPAANIPIQDVTTEYDGQPHSLTLPATIRTTAGTLTLTDEFTVQYRDAAGNVTDTMPAYTDVGVYPVTVILTSISGNFQPEEVTASVTVTPRALKVSYGKVSVPYDGLPHTVPLTVTGLVSRDTLLLTEQNRTLTDVTYLDDGTPGALVATATAWQLTDAVDPTIDRSANYTLTLVPGSIEIKPMAIRITVANLTAQYDGLPHTLNSYTVTGALKPGETLNVTLEANTATNVVDSRTVTVASATITNDLTGENTTQNYAITIVPGKLSITPRPLSLMATRLTVLYDGLPHTPDVYISGTELLPGDQLAYTVLDNMPQTDIGNYPRVTFSKGKTVILNANGQDVTKNYKIIYTPGALSITQPNVSYTINYYYDGVLQSTATLNGTRGDVIDSYPPRLIVGFRFDHAEHIPMTLGRDPAANVASIYYVSGSPLTTLEDVLTPLGGNASSNERGTAVE